MANRSTNLRFHVVTSEADVNDIVEIAREAHTESRFNYITFSEEKVCKLVHRALSDPKRHAFMLAHRHNVPVGLAHCSIGEYHIGTGALLTTIHNINVRSSVRSALGGGRIFLGLLRGVETWSSSRNAAELLIHVTSGVQIDRFMSTAKRLGFQPIGGNLSKPVKSKTTA